VAIFGLFGRPNVHKLGAKGDVMGLIKALTYKKDVSVRRLAAFALGKIGDDRALLPLVTALKDSNYLVSGAAGGALLEIDVKWNQSKAASAAVPMLIAVLKGTHAYLHRERGDGYGDEREDCAHYVRNIAAATLGKIGDDCSIEALIGALRDERDAIRYTAVEALGKLADTRAVKPLIAALMYGDYVACKAAFRSLDKIDPSWRKSEAASAAVPMFIAGLKDSDNCVRWAAGEALDKIGVARPA